MASISITNFGSAWAGGYSINSISQGSEGWVYLAGEKYISATDTNPVVLAYQNGILKWEKDFGGSKNSENFRSVYTANGYVYAAGGIRDGFDSTQLDNQQFPADKPPNTIEPNLNCAPFFVKLDAADGSLQLARVLNTNYDGNSQFNGILADEADNFYVIGGAEIGTESYTAGLTLWGLRKYQSDGSLSWKIMPGDVRSDAQLDGNFNSLKLDDEGHIYTISGYQIAKITYDNSVLGTYFPIVPANPNSQNNNEDGTYLQDFLVDSNGDIYTVAFESTSSSDWSAGTTVVSKIKNLHNRYSSPSDADFLWTKKFEGLNNTPSSICFDASGNLLVAGSMKGGLNGVSSKGNFDGYLVTIDPSNGNLLDTTLIGTQKNEWLTQAMVTDSGDVLISGEFSSKFYSIENTNYQNIYLISKDGFTLMGNDLDNEIQSGHGNDNVSAGLGNDHIATGAGNDTVDAGAGDDLIVGGDGAGNDTYNGGTGEDTVKYTSALAGIRVDLTKGTATSIDKNDASHIGNDKLIGIEDVIAGYHNDVITGSAVANRLHGEAGDDVLKGGAGNDYIDGDDGVDTADYSDKKTSVVVILNGATESSVVIGSGNAVETDTIVNIENIIGGSAADTLTGDDADNVLAGGVGNDTLASGAGNDTLDGGVANDSLLGGAGDDIYIVDNVKDIVAESSNEGADEVRSSVSWTLGAHFENVTLTGVGAINSTGNELDNVITGNAGKNILSGGAGNDTIYGGAADDTLNGGSGVNQLVGGSGKDVYIINMSQITHESINNNYEKTTIVDSSGGNVLKFVTAQTEVDYENWIFRVNDGKDLVYCYNYNLGDNGDSLIQTYMTNGVIDVEGLLQDGSHYFLIKDQYATAGTNGYNDTVSTIYAGTSFQTSDSKWDLKFNLAGFKYSNNKIDGTVANDLMVSTGECLYGKAGNDVLDAQVNGTDIELYGGEGNDELTGGWGDDIIRGGVGNDTLIGRKGSDKFQFGFDAGYKLNTKTNLDLIKDFDIEEGDKLVLDKLVFTAVKSGVTTENIISGTTVNLAAHIYDTNDYLRFNADNHTLYYDADGSGKGAAVAIVQLTGVTELHATDFIIA